MKLTTKRKQRAGRLYKLGLSYKKIGELLEVSGQTVMNYLKKK